jgi:peptide/nickel transport system substrate-binding protein
MKRRVLALLGIALLAGCDQRRHAGSIVVSAIGAARMPADAARGEQPLPTRLLIDATAQGLVRFDAGGQIEPGIAERWIVTDGGMSYIFRLRDAVWSDGKPVKSDEVVAILRRQTARHSRNPLLPFLSAIDDVVEMTPEVIEVRLSRPRPDLLKLFAQPEMAIFRANPPAGSGPMRIVGRSPQAATLAPAPDPDRDPDDDDAQPKADSHVRLIAERPALAIARFAAKESDLVSGGTFDDWPLLAAADVTPANLRTDPAEGLFGLAVKSRSGFLADPRNRTAIAEAIDRDALVRALAPNWTGMLQLLPDRLDSAADPALPSWATLPLDQRIADAQARVSAWQATTPGPLALRIAMPPGLGATILYAHIAAALYRIGIVPKRVAPEAEAELRLVDSVAPYDSARWYLRNACQPCSTIVAAEIEAARDAPDLAQRARHIAAADKALVADTAFIPLATPLRWSLVALRLDAWQRNSRAWHPLNHLRNDTN